MLILDSDLLALRGDGTPRRLDASMEVGVSIYREFRVNDDQIDARIPDVVWNFLGHAGEADFMQRTDFARELVFAHLYGRFDLQMMKLHREGFYFRGYQEVESEFRHYQNTPGEMMEELRLVGKIKKPRLLLGNAEAQLKLAMPRRMAEDVR